MGTKRQLKRINNRIETRKKVEPKGVGIIELKNYPFMEKEIDKYIKRVSEVNDILDKARIFKAKSFAILEQISKFRYGFAQNLQKIGIQNKTWKAIQLSEKYLNSEKELRLAADKLDTQNAAAVTALIGAIMRMEGVADKTFTFKEGKIIVNLA